MKARRAIRIALALVVGLLFAGPVTRASERDQATQLTFTQPVQIPGNVVLQPGTYWFKIADSQSDRNIVEVFDVNWQPITTVIAASTELATPYDNTMLTFAEKSEGQPLALLEWFYPGNTIGHEFVYSGNEGQALSEEMTNVVSVLGEPAPMAPAYSAPNARY